MNRNYHKQEQGQYLLNFLQNRVTETLKTRSFNAQSNDSQKKFLRPLIYSKIFKFQNFRKKFQALFWSFAEPHFAANQYFCFSILFFLCIAAPLLQGLKDTSFDLVEKNSFYFFFGLLLWRGEGPGPETLFLAHTPAQNNIFDPSDSENDA